MARAVTPIPKEVGHHDYDEPEHEILGFPMNQREALEGRIIEVNEQGEPNQVDGLLPGSVQKIARHLFRSVEIDLLSSRVEVFEGDDEYEEWD